MLSERYTLQKLCELVADRDASFASRVLAAPLTRRSVCPFGLYPPFRSLLVRACQQTDAESPRCRVHFARNLLALVPLSHKDMVAALFRTIFAQPNAEAVAATWDSVHEQLAAGFPRSAR